MKQINKDEVEGLQRKVVNMEMNHESEGEKAGEGYPSIREFFRERCVFITGGTGFVGKILVEKILRCCPELEKIYLLMRPKKGLKPEERLQQLIKTELFSILRKQEPHFEKRIAIFYGDINQPEMGLSVEDLDTLRAKVSVVFHSAARVRYDDPLKIAVQHHLIATKRILAVCRTMPKLVSLIYVSTAYVYRGPDYVVPEQIVPCDVKPDELIRALEWMDEDTINKITPYLLKKRLNTYFLTKALTEEIIQAEHGSIPVAIVRPCIICNTWKEPIPGWCDTIQGPSGLFLAAAKGFLRTLYSVPGLKIAIIPADIVVNTMIAASWFAAKERSLEVLIVNCVHDEDKLILAGEEMLKMTLKKRDEYPLANMYRYPDFTLYYSPILYKIHAFWDQYVPAYFFDFFLYIFTGQHFMVRLYKRIEYIFQVFVIAGTEPWIIKNANYHLVKNAMSAEDKQEFSMELDTIDWPEYLDICMKGGRVFLAHEEPSNIPYARRKAKTWWFVTTVLKWMIIFGLLYYMFSSYLMCYINDV